MTTLGERFTRCWTQAQPLVASYVHALVPDVHEAEDLLQEVALVLLRKFSEYDAGRSFVGWAIGVAKLEVLSRRRSHARSLLAFKPTLAEAFAEVYQREAEDFSEDARALRECVRGVRGKAWEAVKFRYEEALPPREIAARLAMSAGAVRVLLSRVRAALQECVRRRRALAGGSI